MGGAVGGIDSDEGARQVPVNVHLTPCNLKLEMGLTSFPRVDFLSTQQGARGVPNSKSSPLSCGSSTGLGMSATHPSQVQPPCRIPIGDQSSPSVFQKLGLDNLRRESIYKVRMYFNKMLWQHQYKQRHLLLCSLEQQLKWLKKVVKTRD